MSSRIIYGSQASGRAAVQSASDAVVEVSKPRENPGTPVSHLTTHISLPASNL